jgi:hypothetical protein
VSDDWERRVEIEFVETYLAELLELRWMTLLDHWRLQSLQPGDVVRYVNSAETGAVLRVDRSPLSPGGITKWYVEWSDGTFFTYGDADLGKFEILVLASDAAAEQ